MTVLIFSSVKKTRLLSGGADAALVEYPETPEGVIQSAVERFVSIVTV